MRYGLIGEKLGHSFSKIIHEQLADYTYDLIPLTRDELDAFLREKQFAALNVTIPYKETVIPYLDEVDSRAQRIGAVNTVVNRNGRLCGYNTDFYGFRYLLQKNGIDVAGKKALVLGKGGASKALSAHHERTKDSYASNPDIDTSRSRYNFHIVKPEGRYYHFIQSRIEQAGCRTRKDSTRFVDTLITASPEFFKGKSPKEIAAYFQRAADFLIDRVGRENIVSAVVHMDEKTPHLHLTFVPLTKDNRLCAKEIIGNRASLTKWQDDFHAYMVEKYPDLERGESASKTGRKHIPTRLFKQAVSLSKQARAIEAALDSITPLNAGKKKAETLNLLKKWFPQMENFSGQLKKYKVTINDLLAENETLEARAKASEKDKMKGVIERAKLESELHNIQRLVGRIPPEVLAELKRQPNYGKER